MNIHGNRGTVSQYTQNVCYDTASNSYITVLYSFYILLVHHPESHYEDDEEFLNLIIKTKLNKVKSTYSAITFSLLIWASFLFFYRSIFIKYSVCQTTKGADAFKFI